MCQSFCPPGGGGGEGGLHGRGAYLVRAGGYVWWGPCMARAHVWQRACVVGDGAYMPGGHALWGAYVAGGGEHTWQGGVHAGEMANKAGGTHPTGMYSCKIKLT